MKAIIIGCNGQDGTILYNLLLKKRYKILGIDKDSNRSNIKIKGFSKKINILNRKDVFDIIKKFKPDEIYHLAAFHHSAEDKVLDNIELFQKSYNINVYSLINFLEGIKRFSRKTRLFYACSSHIFGSAKSKFQDENTPINPSNIYGITKAEGLFICRLYRNNYSLKISTGILYNHESHIRSPKFLSKRIVKTAIDIKNKKKNKLIIGNLNAEVDWGYAPDYVDAMYKILKLKSGDDFIIASGKNHKVKEFVKEVFDLLGLDWKKYVKEDKKIISKKSLVLIGKSNKLKKATGWKPTVDFKKMIKILVEKELNNGR